MPASPRHATQRKAAFGEEGVDLEGGGDGDESKKGRASPCDGTDARRRARRVVEGVRRRCGAWCASLLGAVVRRLEGGECPWALAGAAGAWAACALAALALGWSRGKDGALWLGLAACACFGCTHHERGRVVRFGIHKDGARRRG